LNLAYTLEYFGRFPEALEAVARGLAKDEPELYRARLLEKQRQILTALSGRYQSEQERLMRRTTRFQVA
jgi:hypothetical protein